MRVKQLGNGGGFDFDKTNSSFLININHTLVLFDCGYNIMSRLQEFDVIEDIDYVYISHMDEDHIGNLKMLIYWRYFMLGKSTTIISHFSLKEDLYKYLKNMNKEYMGCMSVDANMFTIVEPSQVLSFKLFTTPTNHGDLVCHGAIFVDIEENKSVFISGDTKAMKQIEEFVSKYENVLKFHDFSHWDDVTRNVHACETDYNLQYSEEFRKDMIKYHTGDEDFNKDWIEL